MMTDEQLAKLKSWAETNTYDGDDHFANDVLRLIARTKAAEAVCGMVEASIAAPSWDALPPTFDADCDAALAAWRRARGIEP